MKKSLLTITWCLSVLSPSPAAVLKVPLEHPTIQGALDAGREGDTVLVAPGRYEITQPISFKGKALTLRSERGASETTIARAIGFRDDRGSVVIFESGETETAVIDGFTLTGGSSYVGGGVQCRNGSSPTLLRCAITGNLGYEGGGISCRGNSSPRITGCTIADNRGVGVDCHSSSPLLDACTISRNEEGGIRCREQSSPTLKDCTISGNSGFSYRSAGLACESSSSPLVEGCRITGNFRLGLSLDSYSSPILKDCIISANRGTGVLTSGFSSPTLIRCTLAGNAASDIDGGGISIWTNGAATLESSIVWGNAGGSFGGESPGSIVATYSSIESDPVWPGAGNTNRDPLFCGWGSRTVVHVNASSSGPGDGSESAPYTELEEALRYDLALSEGSPCLGAGKGGRDMGVPAGRCGEGGEPARLVRLAAGAYSMRHGGLAFQVSLQGAGQDETVLEGSVVGLRAGAAISDLTVTGGETGIVVARGEAPEIRRLTITGNQGGVSCHSASPVIEDCAIRGNAGVGLACLSSSSPEVERCTITGNSGFGLRCDKASPKLSACTIRGNRRSGVYCSSESSPRLVSSTIASNAVEAWDFEAGAGGGLYCLTSSPILIDCAITANSARLGGGIYAGALSFPVLTGCTIAGNTASSGGGLYAEESSRTGLTGCILWGNAGGSIQGSLEASYSCIEGQGVAPGAGNINLDPLFCLWAGKREVHVDPLAPEGGDGSEARPYSELGEALDFSLALESGSPCIGTGKDGATMGVERGTCEGGPGGFRMVNLAAGAYDLPVVNLGAGTSLRGAGEGKTFITAVVGARSGATLSHLTIRNGMVMLPGEAPEVIHCWIVGNSRSFGGGVFLLPGAAPAFRSCVIAGNRGMFGGGIYCSAGSTPTFINSLIIHNTVLPRGGSAVIIPSFGGGLYCEWGSAPTLINCTIGRNRGEDGAGIYSESGSLRLTNCIVWGNQGDAILGSALAAHSCIEGEGVWPGAGNIRLDPLFVPDGFQLDPASPAIDRGIAEGAPADDLEGNRRPCWQGIDMGAHEYCEDLPPSSAMRFVRGDPDGDGQSTIGDAISTLDHLFLGGPRPRCLKGSDVNDSGAVDVTDPIYLLGYLFLGGPPPRPPHPDCGRDPSLDPLRCDSYPPCS